MRSFKADMQLTYFGANGWLIELGGVRVLLDPWLTGPLQFGSATWFFEGHLPHDWPVPENLDLLLLSQGLPDHAHPPSLALLPKNLPVLGSCSAIKLASSLGFTNCKALKPRDHHQHGCLQIETTAGAAVPQLENGYLLRAGTESLYVEPHGFLDPQIAVQPLTAVITPVLDLGLPLAGAFVKGQSVLPQLLERFQPSWLLASTAGGGINYKGVLERLLWSSGDQSKLEAQLALRHPPTTFIDPDPGHCYELNPA